MKIGAADVPRFLANPPAACTAVVIFGADDGLVHERAEALAAAFLGSDRGDPFRTVSLTPDAIRKDAALLGDEARSLSLIGGRRLVRIAEATDALAEPLRAVLDGPVAALILIEAGDLDRRSALRKLAEAAPQAAAIACYPDGPRELAELVRGTLGRHRIQTSEEAVAYLVESLGGDRLMTRQELEKLALFAGDGGRIGLEDAVASVGDQSLLAIDDLVFDALDGKVGEVDQALTRLFQEGEAAVTLLRAGLRHAQRLHLLAARIAAGETVEHAMAGLRPPIFFKLEARFRAQLRAWSLGRLERLMALLARAEAECKRTGFPDTTLCRHAFLDAARLARVRG